MEDLTSRLKKGISQYCEKKSLDLASVTNRDVKTLVDQHVNIDHVEHDTVMKKLSYVVSVKSDATFHCARSSDRSTMVTETASEQDKETERLASLPFAGLFYGFFAGLVAMLFTQEWFNCIIAAILAGAFAEVITVPIIVHNIWQAGHLTIYLLKALLPICFATFVLFVIPSVAVAAVVGVADGFYTRATLAGVITSTIAGEFNTQAVRALLGTAETNNYAYVLVLYFALLLGVLGVIDVASIVGAFLGAYVGTTVYQELIGGLNAVIGVLPGEIWGTVVYKRAINRYLAYGVCSGAIIGALGIVNGAITGAIMGAIMAKPGGIDTHTYIMHVSKSCSTYPLPGIDQFETFENCGSIHPYSIADRVIVGAIRVVIIILRPITNVTNAIIHSQSVASEVILGAIFGAVIGAFAGVTGGAFTGVIVAGLILGSYYCLGVTMVGELVLLIGERAPSVRHAIGRDAGRAIDKNCCLIFVGILCTALSSVTGAYAGGYFIASALSGEFGSVMSWFIGCVVALFKIGNSALTGGLVGIFIGIKVYRTFVKAVSDDMTVQIFVFGFGIGAISGALMTIGDTLWQIFWMPMYIGGATLGAISGSVVGFIAKIIIMEKLADTAIANVGGIVGTISAMVGGFVGGLVGVYLTSSVIFTGLSGITFSIISIAILTVIRQRRIKQGIIIPLNDIIATFGTVTKSNIDQDRGGRWIQYKVNCHYVVPR